MLVVIVAILSERTRRRAPFIMATSSLAVIGYIILLSTHSPGSSYVGVFFAAAGIYPSAAIVLSWPANNVSGQTKRAIANAMQISIGNVGHGMALAYLVANVAVVGILWLVLNKENEKKAAIREAEGIAPLEEVGIAQDGYQGDEDPRWVFQT
jgi:hypothetical protein